MDGTDITKYILEGKYIKSRYMTMLFWILHFPHTCVMPCMVHWISLKGLWIVVGSCSADVFCTMFFVLIATLYFIMI